MRSKLTSKGRVTIPNRVRDALGLKPGDLITYEISDDNSVVLRRLDRFNASFHDAVSETLGEWLSDADENAILTNRREKELDWAHGNHG